MSGCENPATWKHGTWYACDDCIKPILGNPPGAFLNMFHGTKQRTPAEMFEEGRGETIYGSAYRADDYFEPYPEMNDEWLELSTVEIE